MLHRPAANTVELLTPRTLHLALALDHHRPHSALQPPRTALVMPRAGAGLQSGSWRNFAAQSDLEATLRGALAPQGGEVRVVPTPGGATPLCEQVALWAEADQILTPNGAHFVNAIFMREGATLLEGVPWAMRNYTGQLAITRRTLHVHGMCTADAWHVHGMMMCTACALQMHGRRMACARHVHCITRHTCTCTGTCTCTCT